MTAHVTVRPFQSSDADEVMSLWEESLPSSRPWNDPLQVICRKRHQNDDLFLVGVQDRRVVATVLAGYDGVRGWIYYLAVASICRRRGIGRQMLTAAEQAVQNKGCAKVNLQVRASNSGVTQFYERCGYQVEDRASLGKPLRSEFQKTVDPVPTIRVNDEITLSQITWDDKPAYLSHLNETDAFQQNMGYMPFPYTDIDADGWISKVAAETLEHDRCRSWAIRDSAGRLIGGIGAGGLVENETAEMGYWIAKGCWGRGIATAAATALSDFVLENYKVGKVFARAFGNNPASARVLEKSGFTLEGTLRRHFCRDGRTYDILCYGRLSPLRS